MSTIQKVQVPVFLSGDKNNEMFQFMVHCNSHSGTKQKEELTTEQRQSQLWISEGQLLTDRHMKVRVYTTSDQAQ